ncbi:MAG: SHOCT domain-containing protein [Actinobacteria bacterium]|nr:SHOCT domain-containing protein [Actinomycetota bacterium]
MMYWGGGWNAAGGWIMGIGMIAFVALIVVGIYLLVRASGPSSSVAGWVNNSAPAPRSSALDVLDARYARGEIDRDEYLARRQDMLGRS